MDRPNDEEQPMVHEVRQRIVRPATPEEKERHAQIREKTEGEVPELKRWAREAAARHAGRIPVGTVFGEEEADVVQAIDHYAAGHALANRSAVVREALAQLLRIDIQRQPSGQR
jgi:transposase